MVIPVKYEAIAAGRTVDEAINAACEKLGMEREQVEVEILELPSKRLLGLLGGSGAKVRVWHEESASARAKTYLSEILEHMDLGATEITEEESEEGVVFDIEGDGMGVIIGHRGETLDALQYLTSLVANRGEEAYRRVTLDTGGYRKKREQTLEALAKRIAQNAVRTRRSTTLESMNPYERRIIHTAVQEVKGATSWSVGEDPNRRVVIGAERARPGGQGPRPSREGAE